MKLFIIFLLSLSLFASDYESHSDKHINKELSHLNLTPQQHQEIKSILKTFRSDLKEYRDFKKEIEKQREKLFLKEKLDTQKLNELHTRLDFKAHAIENRLLSKVHALLNHKQRVKFIDYFDDWKVE